MKGLIELKFRGKKETKGYQAALNILGFDRQDCANVDQRYIDYWIYMEGGTTWDLSCYGLLRFLIECFVEIDQPHRRWDKNDTLRDVAQEVRNKLEAMLSYLNKLEIELVIDLSEYTYLIQEAKLRYPDKQITKVGKLYEIKKEGNQLFSFQEDQLQTRDMAILADKKQKHSDDTNPEITNRINHFLISHSVGFEDLYRMLRDKDYFIPEKEVVLKL